MPAMEGATVTFKCPPQYVLTDPNTKHMWGMENGNQTLGEVECNGKILLATLY